jgi:hypothetical protein
MKKHQVLLGAAAGLLLLAGSALLVPVIVEATPPVPTPTAAAVRATTSDVDAGVAQEDPTTATIVFATSPPVSAMVFWGRKNLGKITGGKPLVVVRPRDSGPLDVIVRANGYLPVQTRAHTFSDQRVVVKLTPPEKKSELLGYKAPLDAGVDMSKEAALEALADAGTPTPIAPPPFQVVPTSTPAGQSPLLSP